MSIAPTSRRRGVDLPDLRGRTALVTGATSGIGLETAKGLARAGADVLLGARHPGRGAAARAVVQAWAPRSRVGVVPIDLAALDSIAEAAAAVAGAVSRLDILCNNAGVMGTPQGFTADGFELQLGTNHLGHFALTGRLLPLLRAAPAARVVTVSSINHRAGRIDFDNLDGRAGYRRWPAYAQSKLANLLFAFELQRRVTAAGEPGPTSVACHPGYTATNLQRVGPRMDGSALRERLMGISNRLLAQSPAEGARPTLYAATAPELLGGEYIGPNGPGQLRGAPGPLTASSAADDADVARRLWEVSEELTGVRYDLPAPVRG